MERRIETPAPSEKRVIKRYANRKLYDTRDSRYVTLQQIAEFVREGQDVQIIDNKSKEDLTNVTLAQIVYEEEKKGEASRSVGTLREMIQRGGQLMTRVGRFVRPGEDEEAADSGEPPAQAAIPAEKRSVVEKSRQALDELYRKADGRVRPLVDNAMAHVRELQAEVKRLQARVEELEERLKKATRRGRKADPEDADDRDGEPTE